MKQQIHPNAENLQVPPIISPQKLQHFKYKVLSTLTGLHILADRQQTTLQSNIATIITYFIIPLLIIIPASVLPTNLHPLAVLLPSIISPVISYGADLLTKRKNNLIKYVCTMIYSYLWSVHFVSSKQTLNQQVIASGTYAAITILSIITVLTSASTISLFPSPQFSSSTPHNDSPFLHSTLYCRFYILAPLLFTQTIIYYCRNDGDWIYVIPYINFVVSLGFVLWWFGWISSLYNMSMWLCRNLLNGVVFGEQVTHSGNNYRGKIWWSNYLILALNILAIGVNISIFAPSFSPTSHQVQSQHVLLICMSTFTSTIVAISVYFYLVFISSPKPAFTCKQYLTILANLSTPLIVCLLTVFGVSRIYGGYANGASYEFANDFRIQKLTTWIFLLADVIAYVFVVIMKDITKTRNVFGIKVCGFSYNFINIQNTLTNNLLKITGSLSIMVLTLRLQNIPVLSSYILSVTPSSTDPNPHVLFFTQYILIPILIYRSYKRTQYFNHMFHITIIVSFVLTIIDSTTFIYESIFVVFAFPFIGDNILLLLAVSPFSTPQKLKHQNENCRKIGYLIGNFFCGIVYLVTLGTLELTMIFGLPVYWCVIPSINSHTPSKLKSAKIHPTKHQSSIHASSEPSIERSQGEILQNQENIQQTPQHNLYAKIVKQLPYAIFRNKKPGYYLLRISKYILIVQITTQFYGIFQVISFTGLQVQQTTSCHAKQGQVIDRMCQNTWGQQQNIQKFTCDDTIKNILTQQLSTKATITSQNQMQMTGIIQSEQFYQLFKKCIIKCIMYYYNTMLQQQSGKLTEKQTKQAQELIGDLSHKINQDKVNEIYPFEFQKNLQFQAKYNADTNGSKIIKKKLPPISKKDQLKKQQIMDDWGDLLNNNSNKAPKQPEPIPNIQPEASAETTPIPIQSIPLSQLHMGIIFSIYFHILGRVNYLIPQKLFKMLKKQNPNSSELDFDKSYQLISQAVGCALKLSISKNLQGQTDIEYDDIVDYQKNEYLGVKQSNNFIESIQKQKPQIWTCSYIKKTLSFKRLAKIQLPLYMFSINNNILQSIWNNLRFELLYAENDNDQRYSIQTHGYFMRNLIIQAAEGPYGYAGYYGTPQICI